MTGGDPWPEMGKPPPEMVVVDGIELRRGDRVQLHPRNKGDIFDLSLDGRLAIIEGIEQDLEDNTLVAVTLEDDPGRDLGEARRPGHRFFFSADEIGPWGKGPGDESHGPRVLVAGIGNIFLGDDGWGVEVARALASRGQPAGIKVVDFGIRGLDLAYALQEGWETVIFLDASPRGDAPGTVYVIEHDERPEEEEVVLDTHGMDPLKVLALARRLGEVPDRILVVACEPQNVLTGESYDDMLVELSDPVRAAVGEAVNIVESLVADLLATGPPANTG
jgi:hydrogenase maturation protease